MYDTFTCKVYGLFAVALIFTIAACSTTPGLEAETNNVSEFQINATVEGKTFTYAFSIEKEEGQQFIASLIENYRRAAEAVGVVADLEVWREGRRVETMQLGTETTGSPEVLVVVYSKLATDMAKLKHIDLTLNSIAEGTASKVMLEDLAYICSVPTAGEPECHLKGEAGGTTVDIEVQGILCVGAVCDDPPAYS